MARSAARVRAQREARAIAAAAGARRRPAGPPCSIAASGHRELIEELVRLGFTHRRVAEILRERKGVRIPERQIGHHLRGRCKCQLET